MTKTGKTTIALFAIVLATPVSVYANSSWHWLTNRRPYDLLVFAIIGTVAIETICIYLATHKNCFLKTIITVSIANLASFLIPYLFVRLVPKLLYTYEQMKEHTPLFMIGAGYFIVTILFELPIVFLTMRKQFNANKQAALIIIGSNLLTTIMVFFVERFYAPGAW